MACADTMAGPPLVGTGVGMRVWHIGDAVAPLQACLQRGGVLAIPTESSYGLAADPTHPRGVMSIFRIKDRQPGKPLPVVGADAEQLASLSLDRKDPAWRYAARRWPAALTAIVPFACPVGARPAAAVAAADGPSLAVRVPGHQPLRALLRQLGTPLTATSANRSGASPILEPAQLVPLLAGVDAWVVDGGPLAGGPPSTLITAIDGRLQTLRQGPIVLEEEDER